MIQIPVEIEISIPGAASRIAVDRRGDVRRVERLVAVAVTRVGVQRGGAGGHARARRLGQLRRRTRDARLAVAVQAGLEDHAIGAEIAANRSAQMRNVQRVPTHGIRASVAAKLPTSPPAVPSA